MRREGIEGLRRARAAAGVPVDEKETQMLMNDQPPPAVPGAELALVVRLLDLLADPKAAKSRVAELDRVTAEARKAIDRAAKDTAAAAKLKKDTEAELAAAREQQKAKLADEREAHVDAMNREREDIAELKKQAADLKAKAEADAAAAAKARAEAQR